ncbi:hypothetical protein QQX09_13375 [Demequina sp. SYSU T00192]|uniref:Uncharacterized protein n=1 Tax=Demequina litoralis TaxID=3051660 RepID=A0ABT8GCJ1_9MICO|nr:hypothetical protein [Demequina sp. SYSU T00192]MDN4476845.1 hypothetical protein [Demequina sp. SYSU T00192]
MDEFTDDGLSIEDDLDIWLAMQPKPQSPVVWEEVGWHRRPTSSRRRLAIQIGRLNECFDMGFARRRNAAVWARVTWRPDGYVIEVPSGPDRDGPPRRIASTADMLAPLATTSEAARVTWAWLRGEVPDGYVLVAA